MHPKEHRLSRRSFQHLLGASFLATSGLLANEKSDSKVTQLYKSLSDEQKSKLCLQSDDPRKNYINNWWYVHKEHRIHNSFKQDQIELISDIFDDFHNPEYQQVISKQVENDMYGRDRNTPSVAFFGKPGDRDFEFIYTGHHVTRRCNGNSHRGQGFAGPVFYGTFVEAFNETKDHPGNPYWYQSLLLHTWTQKLSPKEKQQLVDPQHPRSEKSIYVLEPNEPKAPGLRIGSLSQDLQDEFIYTITNMLAIFRKDDVDITVKQIKPKLKNLYLACYSGRFDLGEDKVYDTWQIEAPGLIWYHRGVPHIHAYFDLKA